MEKYECTILCESSKFTVKDFCIKVIVMPLSINGRVILHFVAGHVKPVIRCLQSFKYKVFILCEKKQEPLLACNYHKIDGMMSQLLSLLNLHFYSIWIYEILFQK